jgi:membrane fusion protein (multidrug efflux system)
MLVLACAIGGYFVWRYLDTYESTDDAQIDGSMTSVSPRIAGTVVAVHVSENDQVKTGQLLVEMDPADAVLAVKQAEAALALAQAQVRMAEPEVPMTGVTTRTMINTTEAAAKGADAEVTATERDHEAALARLRQAEAANANAQSELARYKKLVDKEEVSRQDYEQRVDTARATTAGVENARASAAAIQKMIEMKKAGLEQTRSRVDQAQKNAPQQVAVQQATLGARRAAVDAAQAALEVAKLNLTYTKITSPVTGQIGRKAVEVGMRIEPGQLLMAVVPAEDIWITANFKETQLQRMKPGQRATVSVDALGRDYEGFVESLSPATGARFSILPPENTSGNYVKVVQRLPVRLRLKPGQDSMDRLRRGMSVVPKVWLQ